MSANDQSGPQDPLVDHVRETLRREVRHLTERIGQAERHREQLLVSMGQVEKGLAHYIEALEQIEKALDATGG